MTLDFSTNEVSILHLETDDKTMLPGYIVLIVFAVLLFLFGVGACTYVMMKKRAAKEAHYTTLYDKVTNGDGNDLNDDED